MDKRRSALVPKPDLAVSRGLLAFILAFLVAPAVSGQEAPTPGATPPAAPEAAPAAPPSPRIDVTGFVDVYYEYNFNKVDPALRTFDVQHNAFSLSLAEIAFAKGVTTDSRVGFRVDLDFGKTADLVAAYEPEPDGKEIYKHVQQAYLSVLAGSKLQLDAGKFVTPLGAEVIESQDNWNYSRSVLFGYAIPFYHMGVRATLPVSDKLSFAGYLVNGWNNSSEIYGGFPGVGVTATVKPSPKLTWIANYMASQEAKTADTRHIFDTTLTLAATTKLSLQANYDYGKEGGMTWWGIAAYAKAQLRPSWAVVARYEYLDDSDGGFMTIGQKAQTLTITSDHLLAGALKLRLEYRGDFTPQPFFVDDTGRKKDSQHALLAGVVVTFGGKI
ncbi:MAG TPA: porin [Vicinamibacteria bacterium]|nr:porin [Vicinamibacteria bacterium]